jgi:alpha-L-arabinofuranosidase
VEPADDTLEITAVLGDGLTVFAVNRGEEELDVDLVVRDLDVTLTEHLVLDGDLALSNTATAERVKPRRVPGGALPARSWNVLRFE